MRAGELRDYIRLLEPRTPRKRASGFVPTDFVPWGEGWAKIDETGGSEGAAHGSRDAVGTLIVTIRFELDRRPTTADVIELPDDGRVLGIESVSNSDNRSNRQYVLTCREGV